MSVTSDWWWFPCMLYMLMLVDCCFFPVVCCNVYLLLLVMFDLCYCCRCCIFGSCVVYVIGDVVCCCLLLLLLLSPLVVVFVVLTSFSADQDETKNVHKPRLSFLYWFTFRYFFRARLITDTCSFIYVHLSFRQDLRYINFTLSYRTIVFDIIFITIPCI